MLVEALEEAKPRALLKIQRALAKLGVAGEDALLGTWEEEALAPHYLIPLGWTLSSNPETGAGTLERLLGMEPGGDSTFPLLGTLAVASNPLTKELKAALDGADENRQLLAAMVGTSRFGEPGKDLFRSMIGSDSEIVLAQVNRALGSKGWVGGEWRKHLVGQLNSAETRDPAIWSLVQSGVELERLFDLAEHQEGARGYLLPSIIQAGDNIREPLVKLALKPSASSFVRRVAMDSLETMGGVSVARTAKFAKLLNTKDVGLRQAVLRLLITSDELHEKVWGHVEAILHSNNEYHRGMACRIVANGQKDSESIRDALLESTRSEIEEVAEAAAYAFSKLKVESKAELDALADLLAREQEDVRLVFAATALGSTRRSLAPEAVSILLESLDLDKVDEESRAFDVRRRKKSGRVIHSLATLGPPGIPGLEHIIRNSKSEAQRVLALRIGLAKSGPESAARLRKYLDSDDGPVVEAACLGLMELGHQDRSMVEALLRVLPVFHEAVDTLGAMGTAAKPAKAYLLRSLKDPKFSGSRFSVAKALGLICPGDRQVMGEYRKILKTRFFGGELRSGCALGAANMGTAAKSLIPDLAKLAKRDSRSTAFAALLTIAPASKQTSELLADASEGNGRAHAFKNAVSRWTAKGEVPLKNTKLLISLVSSKDAHVRLAAMRALSVLGKDGLPALQTIAHTMVEGVPLEVKMVAIEYMQNLGDDALLGLAPLMFCAVHWEMDPNAGMSMPSYDPTPFGDNTTRVFPSIKWTELRVAALKTIGGLGAPAAQAIPILEQLTSDPVREVREAAVAALAKVKP